MNQLEQLFRQYAEMTRRENSVMEGAARISAACEVLTAVSSSFSAEEGEAVYRVLVRVAADIADEVPSLAYLVAQTARRFEHV